MQTCFLPLSFLSFSVLLIFITLVSQRFHMLMTLLLLEMMILSFVILCTLTFISNSNLSFFLILILLTFGACEAGIGLACLVKMARIFGNDQINSSSLMW